MGLSRTTGLHFWCGAFRRPGSGLKLMGGTTFSPHLVSHHLGGSVVMDGWRAVLKPCGEAGECWRSTSCSRTGGSLKVRESYHDLPVVVHSILCPHMQVQQTLTPQWSCLSLHPWKSCSFSIYFTIQRTNISPSRGRLLQGNYDGSAYLTAPECCKRVCTIGLCAVVYR